MPAQQDFPISVEFQFLASLGDGRPRATGALCTPGTHVWQGGRLRERHTLSSSGPTIPPGEWVRAEAIVRGGEITHVVNGQEVNRYSRPEIGGGVVSDYDPAVFVEGRPRTSGYFALQAESSPIDFRKVEIQVLDAER